MAVKVTLLVSSPLPMSSFWALAVKEARVVPVDTEGSVWKLRSRVSIWTCMVVGAVQGQQTECRAVRSLPTRRSSDLVAKALAEEVVEESPVRRVRLAKLSLGGMPWL